MLKAATHIAGLEDANIIEYLLYTLYDLWPRGSICTTIMELGPQNRNGDGLLGSNSIVVVYMDPLVGIESDCLGTGTLIP